MLHSPDPSALILQSVLHTLSSLHANKSGHLGSWWPGRISHMVHCIYGTYGATADITGSFGNSVCLLDATSSPSWYSKSCVDNSMDDEHSVALHPVNMTSTVALYHVQHSSRLLHGCETNLRGKAWVDGQSVVVTQSYYYGYT